MEDQEIIALFFGRSERALQETDRKYRPFLQTVVFRILRSQDDTEEILNDTYLGAWNAIPPERPQSLRHFLGKIARNLSFSRLDYRSAQKRSGILTELEECLPDPRGDAEQAMEAREIGRSLNRFLETLDGKNRAVFLGRYYYAMTAEELAKAYGLSRRQVKYSLTKTRQALRLHLCKEGIVI